MLPLNIVIENPLVKLMDCFTLVTFWISEYPADPLTISPLAKPEAGIELGKLPLGSPPAWNAQPI